MSSKNSKSSLSLKRKPKAGRHVSTQARMKVEGAAVEREAVGKTSSGVVM